ncbi:aminotransferase class IV, partial [PVC group bacterium]|nr:aminotransferase class IV [PVC group bacterium]
REHLERLCESAKAIHLQIPMTLEAMTDAVNESLQVNGIDDGYVRLVVTRGVGTLGLDPAQTSDPQVIIIADRITLYPEEFYTNGLKIVTVSTVRNNPAALSPRIKSLNYLNNILAKIEGKQAGCIEALMLNHKGEVAECTGDNIFLVHDGVLITPSVVFLSFKTFLYFFHATSSLCVFSFTMASCLRLISSVRLLSSLSKT